jgi:hypothetical protein
VCDCIGVPGDGARDVSPRAVRRELRRKMTMNSVDWAEIREIRASIGE